jgi:RHS repeat-associated protein
LGRIDQINDQIRGIRRFDYDDASRLTAVRTGDDPREPDAESYQFDDQGRMNAGQLGRAAEFLASDGQLIRHLTRDGKQSVTLSYDAKGQLIAAEREDGVAWSYHYDAFGRRTKKVRLEDGEEAERQEYLWDLDVLLAERSIRYGAESRRLYLRDGIFIYACVDELGDGRRVIVFHNDHLGTPDICTDLAGECIWQRKSTAFGAGHDNGDIRQNIGFPGQYWDEELQLYYNYHRHYDPVAARYLQPDPLGATAGWYPHASPTDPQAMADPVGLGTEYRRPNRQGTEHRTLHRDENLLRIEPVGASNNIHRFVGGTQDVVAGSGQNVPRYLGPVGTDSLAGSPQLVIETHGWPGGLDMEGRPINGTQLGNELADRGFNGDRVVLVVCDAGTPGRHGETVAQDLADQLKQRTGRDVEVIAASGKVTNFPDGTLIVGEDVKNIQGDRIGFIEGFGGSKFQSFSAGRPPRDAPGASGTGMWPPRDPQQP